MSRADAIDTQPIENLLQEQPLESERFVKEYLELSRKIGPNKVAHHKKRLGKQDYTFTGEFRMWVWEKPWADGYYRVFVSDKKGVVFEVTEMTVEQALAAWRDYASSVTGPLRSS